MKTIICGSRSITKLLLVERAVELSGFTVTEVVSGRARGVDRIGERWADAHGIPIKPFPAKWRENGHYSPLAGHERNERMARYAEVVIAVWDGHSRGTKHMIDYARLKGLRVFVLNTGAEQTFQRSINFGT